MHRLRFLTLALIFSLASGLLAIAQPIRSETMHVVVSASTDHGTVVPGRRISLIFEIRPKRGMHVYAPGKHDYQVIGVSLDPQPWMRIEPIKYPPSEIHDFPELNERVEVYSKPFTLVQDFSIPMTSAVRKQLTGVASVTVSGVLSYQACDEKVCYAPTKVPVKFVFQVAQVPPSKGR